VSFFGFEVSDPFVRPLFFSVHLFPEVFFGKGRSSAASRSRAERGPRSTQRTALVQRSSAGALAPAAAEFPIYLPQEKYLRIFHCWRFVRRPDSANRMCTEGMERARGRRAEADPGGREGELSTCD